MVDRAGRVLYVGKAKRLRARLLTYFQARYPEDKGAWILQAAHDIEWDYVPSEFAAYLGELREIRRHRPAYNVQLNRRRRAAFLALLRGPAPKLTVTAAAPKEGVRYYGPLSSPGRAAEGLRTLNDLLGLRDCADRLPMAFGQGDLFDRPREAACPRYDLGTCSGPCAGHVSEAAYQTRVATAEAFLEGRSIAPLDRVVAAMMEAADQGEFELAARWRERFDRLEWLLAATTRARTAAELLTFVYRDPGIQGDDRAYVIRGGLVRATYPFPTTPIERDAFQAVIAEELESPGRPTGALDAGTMDETLLVMSWFRRHPEALRRTTALEAWRSDAKAQRRKGPRPTASLRLSALAP